MENRKLLVLKMVNLAMSEVEFNGGLPPGADDFVALVTQYGGGASVTREEVEEVLEMRLKDLVAFSMEETSS
jgi:hypothetical protein